MIIEDRLGKFNIKDAYILFQDCKPNSKNELQSKLINPSKTEQGIFSKNIQIILLNIKKKKNYPKQYLEEFNWYNWMD